MGRIVIESYQIRPIQTLFCRALFEPASFPLPFFPQLPPLLSLAKGTVVVEEGEAKEESEFNQQLALLSIRSFGRALVSKFPANARYPAKLKEVRNTFSFELTCARYFRRYGFTPFEVANFD